MLAYVVECGGAVVDTEGARDGGLTFSLLVRSASALVDSVRDCISFSVKAMVLISGVSS